MIILNPKSGVSFGLCKKLDDFYKAIDCTTIDIARRRICGKMFDIFVDDEGLLKDGYETCVSAVIDEDGTIRPNLVGTLVFANHDESGETTDLSLDDTLLISSRITKIKGINKNTGEEYINYCVVLD